MMAPCGDVPCWGMWGQVLCCINEWNEPENGMVRAERLRMYDYAKVAWGQLYE